MPLLQFVLKCKVDGIEVWHSHHKSESETEQKYVDGAFLMPNIWNCSAALPSPNTTLHFYTAQGFLT